MDIWKELKQQTLKDHEELEHHINALRADFTLEDLSQFLSSFYNVHQALNNHPLLHSHFPHLSQKVKLQRLEQDLTILGHWPPDERAFPLDWVESLEDLFGVLYVMEGSALGGQVLFHHYEKKFGLNLSYFQGEGINTVPLWLQYKDSLGDLFVRHRLNAIKTVHAAKRMFQELAHFL